MILAIVVSRAGRTGFIGRMETAFDWGEIAECRAGLMPLSKHNVCGSSPAVRILRAKGFHPVEVPVSSPASSQIHNGLLSRARELQIAQAARRRSQTETAGFGQATLKRTESAKIRRRVPPVLSPFYMPPSANADCGERIPLYCRRKYRNRRGLGRMARGTRRAAGPAAPQAGSISF